MHVIVGIILIYSFEFSPKPTLSPNPIINIVKAKTIDKNQIDLELKRLRKKDNEKIEKELIRQKKIKKKEEDAKKKKLAKEKLKKLKKKKEQEVKKRKKEEADIKKRKEEKIKLEQENKKRIEKEAQKIAAEKKKEEKIKLEQENKKRIEEEAQKIAAEKKKEEKILQEQLDAELEAEQQERDLTVIQKYQILIRREVNSNFNKVNLPDSLECVILIRMLEGGKVVEASIEKSSGNVLFDRRATNAVYSASPLPVPQEIRLFKKMRTIRFTFDP